MTHNPYPVGDFAIDTPAGMNPVVAAGDALGVPIIGTGLSGLAYAPGDHIWNLERLREVIAENDPDAGFVATEIAYGSWKSDTTLTEFLKDDGASVTGNGDIEIGPSGLTLSACAALRRCRFNVVRDSPEFRSQILISLSPPPDASRFFPGSQAIDVT